MTWRPPIDDPTNNGNFDDRERCTLCGKDREQCYCDEELADDI